MHDPDLNPDLVRGPDGHWIEAPGRALIELPLREIQRFDVGRIKPGSRYAARFPDQRPADGARIPTLAEVAAMTREAGNEVVRFDLETKLAPNEPNLTLPPEAFAAAAVEAVRALGIAGRATIQSFDWRTLRAVQRLAPDIPTVCLTAEQRWLDNIQRGQPGPSSWTAGLDVDDVADVPDLVAAAGCRTWSPFFGDLTPDQVQRAHDQGLEVVVWTANDPDDMHRLIDLGVDGIITDYPDRLRQVMAERDVPLPQATPVVAR
jgi:glycerophosphoryl diester phosphodiesterase